MAQSTSAPDLSTHNSLPEKHPKVILIDGHSLAFRSYFAFAKGRDGGLRTSTGIPTSVSYGFLKALLEVMESEQPDYVAIAFDLSAPTFRHDADETYKAGRPETPEDFKPDLQNLKELLQALNLPVVTAPGYEADDVIGTLARRASAAGYPVKILSGDQDLFQLIDPDQKIKVLHLGNPFARGTTGHPNEFGAEQVQAKLGVLPSQVVDYKALCGDSSDNIPGVKGIGAKTAVQLLSTYGSLEQIYASLDEIKGAVKQKLEAGREEARHSQWMAQIHLDVPLEISLEDCQLKGFDREAVVPLLEKLEFQSLMKKTLQLQKLFGGAGSDAEADNDATPDFSETDGAKAASAIATGTPNNPFLADFESEDLAFFSAEETDAAQQQKQGPALIYPQIIQSSEQLAELVQRLQALTDPATPVAWDTETSDLEPRDAELVGIGCCWGAGESDMAYLPVGHKTGANLDKATVLEALRPFLESTKYPKALQNAKFDRLVFRCQGIELAGVVFDSMLASYVLDPDNSHNLTDLSRRYLGITPQSYTELVPKGQTIADIDIASVANYCGMDVYTTFHLVAKLRDELAPVPEIHRLLLEIEQPLEPVLAEMEYCGVRIDQEYLREFSRSLEKELALIEARAYEAAGEKFNLGSPKQLSELLFEKLGLDRKKSRKTKTGYSTDAATLEKLQGDHPVVDAMLESRTLSKLKSTYVDALPNLVRPDTHRVHTNFNQTGTTTGRLSSSNPNLQNIPIRTAFSRQIRKAFIPEEGWLLAAADYSQIELRILAHLSQEPVLVETYRNNEDVHTLTARLLLEKDTITSEERRLGKIINFGVIYGMGAQRFARESGVKASEAKLFIDRFNQRYPKVFAYLQTMQQQAIARGYVETIFGRRRYFNFTNDNLLKLRGRKPEEIDLDSLRPGQYDAGLLRAAANAPIQGSSADIIKIAMAKLHEILRSHQANLLLQVHDELIFELPPEEWKSLKPQIKSTMETAVQLSVPLLVEINAGKNWMETK
ncbi:DNA polymerase I [Trichocoleus sp. FACHB-591]|uniref:DNA polymerase I n=1 Tax=Trichocoleus sp. FACHB-591 TaxID=2692872 RepID=UPI0016845512|nr:DNA polymerase I [Trichocoleus sp. FACHB-591]MBD2095362.1 DNA polymerase I [Trichocoleus sp. FACHB-591]